jgi:5-methylcytosine-specific restriction endonuclease McrA
VTRAVSICPHNVSPKSKCAQCKRDRECRRRKSNPERESERVLAWYYENRERAKERRRQRYQENRKKELERVAEYQQANPEKRAVYRNVRRARKHGNGGKFTAREWKQLKATYDYTCLRCRRREPQIKLTPDHVIPLEKGGSNSIKNIQPLCGTCNSSKGIKTTDYRTRYGH